MSNRYTFELVFGAKTGSEIHPVNRHTMLLQEQRSSARHFCSECGRPIAVGVKHFASSDGIYRLHLGCPEEVS